MNNICVPYVDAAIAHLTYRAALCNELFMFNVGIPQIVRCWNKLRRRKWLCCTRFQTIGWESVFSVTFLFSSSGVYAIMNLLTLHLTAVFPSNVYVVPQLNK